MGQFTALVQEGRKQAVGFTEGRDVFRVRGIEGQRDKGEEYT